MSAVLSDDKIQSSNSSKEKVGISYWLLIPLAFVFSLGACLLHNFIFCESRIVLASDGKHFLTTIQYLVQFLSSVLYHTALPQNFLADSQLAGHILLDGPLMSVLYAPVFLALGKVPDPRDWMILVSAQSWLHALSTCALVYLVLRVTRSPVFAAAAILLYGLYPAAVLQSGHFMSEIPVTSLLLFFVLSLTGTKPRLWVNLLGGIAAALIVLSKPALIPCVGLIAVIGIWRAESRFKQLTGLAAGISIVVLAWGSFCQATTGNFVPTAQRQPLYNVVTGWNVEADGWAYNPHPPFTDLFIEAEGPLNSAKGIWMSHPQESLRLAISKLSRLSSCPWNDFKGRALGLDANAQILFHRLVLTFAAFGAAIYFWCGRRFLNKAQRTIIIISFAAIVSHLAYLLVECQPRYTFTAIPFVVLLAAYGFWQAAQISFDDKKRRLILASSAAFALALVAGLLHAENICAVSDARYLKERTFTLNKGDKVEKVIDLRGVTTPAQTESVVLLIDGDKNIENSTVTINGVTLKETPKSTMHFDAPHYLIFDQMREFAPSMRIAVDDLRQWRAIAVDPTLINWTGTNKIELRARAKESTIYGDGRHTRYYLSPDYCNYGILAAAPVAAGAESRLTEPVLTAACRQASSIMKTNEKVEKLRDTLRIRLAVVPKDSTESSSKTEPETTTEIRTSATLDRKVIPIDRKQFDSVLYDTGSTDALRMNKIVLYSARRVGAEIELPSITPSKHIKIRVSGNLKALHNAGEVGILCALKGSNGHVQIFGKNPRALQATPKWKTFQIDDLMPLDLLGGEAKSIELAFYPCPWMEGQYGVSRRACDALFKDLKVEISAAELPTLSRKRIIY